MEPRRKYRTSDTTSFKQLSLSPVFTTERKHSVRCLYDMILSTCNLGIFASKFLDPVVHIIHWKYLYKEGNRQGDSSKRLSRHIWIYLWQRASATTLRLVSHFWETETDIVSLWMVLSSKQFWNSLISQMHLNAFRQHSRRTAQRHVETLFRVFDSRASGWFESNTVESLKSWAFLWKGEKCVSNKLGFKLSHHSCRICRVN